MAGGPEEFLPLHKVARLFHVDSRTLRRWMTEHGFPQGFYIGKTMFFRSVDIQIFQEKMRLNREPTKSGKSGTNRDKPDIGKERG